MRLTFEQLESRLMAAMVLFDIDWLDCPVSVGDTFTITIMVREIDAYVAGVQGISLDIKWNPDVIEEISSTITENLPGHVETHRDGFARLDGYSFIAGGAGRSIGNLEREQFAEMEFRAVGTGDTDIVMSQGVFGIATQPISSLDSRQLDFETINVVVVDEVFACGVDD